MRQFFGLRAGSFALFVGLAVLGAPASAQTISALKEHDVDQPIDVTANRVEVREKANLALFDGAVKVVQGDMRLNADNLKVHYDPGDAGKGPTIKRLDAQGNIVMTSPSETVESNWAIYDVEQRLLTLGGKVRLSRGDSKIWGERLELNLRSGVTTLDGSARGEERVKGRFAVPQSDDKKNGGDKPEADQ